MAASIEALQETEALKEKPSEEDLDKMSKKVGGNWKSLLIHLGVPNARIETLLEENSNKPTKACFKGLVFWREGNKPCKPATWSVLLEALEEGAEMRVDAKNLREKIVTTAGKRVQQSPQESSPSLSSTLQRRMPPKFTMDERSNKIKEIVVNYRNGEVFVLINLDLEDELDKFMTKKFRSKLLSADPRRVKELQVVMKRKCRSILHTQQASVPNTTEGLYNFIEKKSTIYEIFLVRYAVEVLDDKDLNKDLQEYESKLAKHLREVLTSCKRRRVTLPLRKDHTHMAVVISREQVLLALVLDMKEYFSKYLQLEETLFEGFEEGCTVLFFSILTVDAALLSPKVLSHLSELKRMFGMTHLIVFGCFVCDLEKATIDSALFGFSATCQYELRPRISSYTQAARDVVQHRDTGMSWFRKAADDLDRIFKNVAKVKIAGSSFGVTGGVLSIMGGGLLLGGFTAPAGIALISLGTALGVGGGIAGVGAMIGDIWINRQTLRQANEWIRRGSERCKDLIEKHSDYNEKLDQIKNQFGRSEEKVIETTIGSNKRSNLEMNVPEFRRADIEVKHIISDWNTALEMGVKATAAAFRAGAVITHGVEAGAEAGVVITRGAVQAAGRIIGLSAVFVVVDLALLGKTAYDLNKNKEGTELANNLRQAADDMEMETAQLRPLANFANYL